MCSYDTWFHDSTQRYTKKLEIGIQPSFWWVLREKLNKPFSTAINVIGKDFSKMWSKWYMATKYWSCEKRNWRLDMYLVSLIITIKRVWLSIMRYWDVYCNVLHTVKFLPVPCSKYETTTAKMCTRHMAYTNIKVWRYEPPESAHNPIQIKT